MPDPSLQVPDTAGRRWHGPVLVLAGLLLAGLCSWLAVRRVEWQVVFQSLRDSDYARLILPTLLMLLATILRGVRWRWIVHRQVPGWWVMLSTTFTGLALTALIPLRLGEPARAALLTARSEVPLSRSIGSIAVERAADLLCMLVIALLGMWVLADRLAGTWQLVLSVLVLPCVLLLVLFVLPLRFWRLLSDRCGGSRRLTPLAGLLGMIVRVMTAIRSMLLSWRLLPVLLVSGLIWLLPMLAIGPLFGFAGIDQPWTLAPLILLCTVVGISLPTAPGMIGNFHFAAALSLLAVGVSPEKALVFATFYHLTGVGVTIVVGMAGWVIQPVRVRELMHLTAVGRAEMSMAQN